jgi:hypothetical protein
MHRMSASENPSATLAHHMQDSTHISFGVLTTGFTYRWFKLEGSVFNGREPDENRYDFDAHKWNSRSARFSFMPNRNWAFQVSHGFLRSPEAQEPHADVRRTTASVQYTRPLERGYWANAFVWGRNHLTEHGEARNSNAYTFESTVNFKDKNYLYTRLELGDKSGLLEENIWGRAGLEDAHDHSDVAHVSDVDPHGGVADRWFRVGAMTFGGVRDIIADPALRVGIGADVTFYHVPGDLQSVYGSQPVGFRFFVRLKPGKMSH